MTAKTTAVMDLEGMRLGQVTSDFITLVKSMAQVDQARYPETMGRVFIINTPSAFPMVWRMIKPFLDPVVASKIGIYGSRREWEPVFLDVIGGCRRPRTDAETLNYSNPSH